MSAATISTFRGICWVTLQWLMVSFSNIYLQEKKTIESHHLPQNARRGAQHRQISQIVLPAADGQLPGNTVTPDCKAWIL